MTTTKLLAFKALERPCGQECIDWAIGMLEQGVEHKSVTILAGMTPPFNHFEIASLRDRALADLKVTELPRSHAVKAYVAELALQALADDKDLLHFLKELTNLCIAEDYPSELSDFYRLYFAWLDLRERGVQFYWPGATQENIEQLVRDRLIALNE
jgi:hypothetical protein